MQRTWALACIGLFLVGCAEDDRTETVSADAQQSAASAAADDAVTLKILDHDQIQSLIASKKGKVVVLDAWSTSCAPCIKEFPHLVELHEELGPEKVACVSLSFDYEGLDKPEDQQGRVLKFLQKQNATFDNILNREEADVLYEKMELDSVPVVLVYDQTGKLRQRFDGNYRNEAGGKFTYKDVRALVEELLQTPEA